MWVYFFNFMSSKCCRSSVSNENLVSELRRAKHAKYTPDLEDCLAQKKKMEIIPKYFILITGETAIL